MEISVRGYSRDCGWTYLSKADVSDVRLPESGKWQKAGAVKVQRTRNGIMVRRSPVSLTLNGKYIVDLEFTKDEIGNMFAEAFADVPLKEALVFLPAASKAREI